MNGFIFTLWSVLISFQHLFVRSFLIRAEVRPPPFICCFRYKIKCVFYLVDHRLLFKKKAHPIELILQQVCLLMRRRLQYSF